MAAEPRLRVTRLFTAGLHAGGAGYPNAANTIRILRDRLGVEIVECGGWLPESFHLWRLTRTGFANMALGVARLALRNLWSLMRVVRRRPAKHDPVYVPYPSVFLLWWASFLPRPLRPRLIADAYISLWDSLVRDRGQGDAGGLKGRLIKAVERRALHAADCVLVDTEANKAMYVAEFGLDPERVRSLPLAIDEEVFLSSRRAQRKESGEVTVLFVGTMIPLHGIDTILDAIQRLHDLPDVRFRLVGDGQLSDRVAQFVTGDCGSRVEWVRGWQSIERIAQEIADADICLGVFGGEEKAARVLPFKLYMYLAAGKAIITQGQFSLPVGTPDPPVVAVDILSGVALANAILGLRGDSAVRQRLADEAKSYFTSYLAAGRIAACWGDLLASDAG